MCVYKLSACLFATGIQSQIQYVLFLLLLLPCRLRFASCFMVVVVAVAVVIQFKSSQFQRHFASNKAKKKSVLVIEFYFYAQSVFGRRGYRASSSFVHNKTDQCSIALLKTELFRAYGWLQLYVPRFILRSIWPSAFLHVFWSPKLYVSHLWIKYKIISQQQLKTHVWFIGLVLCVNSSHAPTLIRAIGLNPLNTEFVAKESLDCCGTPLDSFVFFLSILNFYYFMILLAIDFESIYICTYVWNNRFLCFGFDINTATHCLQQTSLFSHHKCPCHSIHTFRLQSHHRRCRLNRRYQNKQSPRLF